MSRFWVKGLVILVALAVVVRLAVYVIKEHRDLKQLTVLFDAQQEVLDSAVKDTKNTLVKSHAVDSQLVQQAKENQLLKDGVAKAKSATIALKQQLKKDSTVLDSLQSQTKIIESQDVEIFKLEVLVTGLGKQLATVSEDRLNLQGSLTRVHNDLLVAQVNNKNLKKEALKREPFLTLDLGVGGATLPLDNFKTGPAITLTARILRLPIIP